MITTPHDSLTVRLRREWIDKTYENYGNLKDIAHKLQLDTSTVSRQFNGTASVGPKFIAAVLTRFPVKFEDAFCVTPTEDPA